MSAILGTSVTGAGGGASVYSVSNSVRLRSSASAFLNRTPSTTTNTTTWTWSGWVKIGTPLAIDGNFFGAYQLDNQLASVGYNTSGNFRVQLYNANSAFYNSVWATNAVFRDNSAWYHIVASVDTTQAGGATNYVKIWVNGVLQTLTVNEFLNPIPQNTGFSVNNSSASHRIGYYRPATPNYYDGYIAEFNFIDGQSLTASSFGETNASTGVWQPKAYAGSYGTNGFYLKFSDIATTSGSNNGLGKDFSGNSNYWNTNNISVTAGSTYDAMTDSPTPVSDTVGNYCVLNPLWYTVNGAGTLSNGNLNFQQGSGVVYGNTFGTVGLPPIGTAGKYYFECVFTNGLLSDVNQGVGIANAANTDDYAGMWPKSSSSITIRSGSQTATGVAYSFNTVVQVAVDCATGSIWFGFNNTWVSGNPSAGTSPTYSNLTSGAVYAPFVSTYSYSVAGNVNFGQRPFAYTPPTGFNRLQTFNLPTPTIGASSTTLANKNFDATLWTGNGGVQTITPAGAFQTDLVWIKSRSGTNTAFITDVVRGATKTIYPSNTAAEFTETTGLTAFTSSGYTLGADTSVNGSGSSYVGWAWKANGTGVTNTAGSITSTVSANTSAGFSVVTYTGNATSGATFGHGLGVAPKMVIVKRRNAVEDWFVNHTSASATAGSYLKLNSTVAVTTGNATVFNNTNPSSTVVTLGTDNGTNASGGTFVAYCFAQISGYSAFGSYAGNSSTDGTFVYTGFRPAYVLIKRSSGAGQWTVRDKSRLGYNPNNYALEANQATAETSSTAYACDLLSNGFKLRTADDAVNETGSTYIYMAFAENPFNYSLAR